MAKEGAKTMLVRDLNHDEVLAVSGGGLLASAAFGALGGAVWAVASEATGDGLQGHDLKKVAIYAGTGAAIGALGPYAARYNYVGRHRA